MECLPIPKRVSESTTPKGVSESTTLSARFKYLGLVLFYSIPHPTLSFQELAEMLEKDFEEASPINPKQDSEQTSPKDIVFNALNILDELVEKLDTSTKILLENEYSNLTEEYASCYRDAAWSRSFEDMRERCETIRRSIMAIFTRSWIFWLRKIQRYYLCRLLFFWSSVLPLCWKSLWSLVSSWSGRKSEDSNLSLSESVLENSLGHFL